MIHTSLYNLHGEPFANTSRPAWLFASRGHQAALQALLEHLKAQQPCLLLLGEPGVGKTFLLHAALAHSDLQHLKTVQVWYPTLSWPDLLRLICRELGLREGTDDALTLAEALHRAVLAEHAQGRQVVLVIDEAHTIPVESLERLMRLSQWRACHGAPLLQLVLVGLPTLGRQFSAPPLRPFQPWTGPRVLLTPLTYGESLAYIRHRLQQAGVRADTVFTPGAVRHVARQARGNPRVMNGLCTQMLLAGFVAQHKPISARMARNLLPGYGTTRSHANRWWGVTAAVSLLAVGALVGLFSSVSPRVVERGLQGLPPLTRRLLPVAGVDPARPPAVRAASPAEAALVAPHQQLEPARPAPVAAIPGSAVGQAPGEGHVGLVPLERQPLEPPPASRVAVLPPSSRPPPPPDAARGRARTACDELQAEIQAKLDAKRLTGYVLTIMANREVHGHQIVGSCEGNTKKITLMRSR